MIQIDEKKCTVCGICIEGCPMSLISKDIGSGLPIMPDTMKPRCVFCGHCEAICPESALTHFYPKNVTTVQKSANLNIEPEQLGVYMRSRRSIRNFKQNQVERTTLLEVMDVVRFSPSGMNQQALSWTVLYSCGEVKMLTDLTVEWMKAMVNAETPLKNIIPFAILVDQYEKGNDRIARNAPHVLIASAHKDDLISNVDSAIALTYLELLLPAYGVGACWAGYLNMALRYAPSIGKALSLPENHVSQGVLMVGHPKYHYYKIPKRKELSIQWR